MLNSIVAHSRRYYLGSVACARPMRSSPHLPRNRHRTRGGSAVRHSLRKHNPIYSESAFNETAFRGEKTSIEETPCRKLRIDFFLQQARRALPSLIQQDVLPIQT